MQQRTPHPSSRNARPLRDVLSGPRELSAMDRPLEREWITRSRVLAAAAALLGIALLAAAYVRYGLTRSLSTSADRVVVATVSEGLYRDYIPVSGSVEPRETVYLDAVNGGQVTQVMVEEGANVKAGQPLVRLTNASLQRQVLNSEEQLSEQLDRLTRTTLQFEQAKPNHARGL